MNGPRGWLLAFGASGLMWLAIAGIVFACVGCATMADIDPIATPPEQYRKNGTFVVETVSPETTALRCFERGALVPANACGSPDLVTIPNPCRKANPNATDRRLCHEFAHAQGWK